MTSMSGSSPALGAGDNSVTTATIVGLADEVWDILVAECGASERDRDAYRLYISINGWPREWRFIGALGFGGKLRHDPRGDRWWVDCYREDETPERLAMIDRTNKALRL